MPIILILKYFNKLFNKIFLIKLNGKMIKINFIFFKKLNLANSCIISNINKFSFLLFAICLFIFQNSQAQKDSINKTKPFNDYLLKKYIDSTQIYPIETHPIFPGGDKQFYCFIDNNIDKKIINSVDIKGTVYIQFDLDTTGMPINFKIIKPLNPIIDNEFLRVLKLMPKWFPGMKLNKPVIVRYRCPLKIPYKNEFCF